MFYIRFGTVLKNCSVYEEHIWYVLTIIYVSYNICLSLLIKALLSLLIYLKQLTVCMPFTCTSKKGVNFEKQAFLVFYP